LTIPARLDPPDRGRADARSRALALLAFAAFGMLAGCCNTPVISTVQSLAVTTPFLGPADFAGSFTPRTGNAVNGLQSTYGGFIVVSMMDRTVVEKALPAGVKLASPLAGSSQHPVIHLIGDQREPSVLIAGVATPIVTARDYREMILLVPFAVNGTGTRWHNHVVRMFLDDISAVAGGNTAYGYAKELARVVATATTSGTRNEATDLFGGPHFVSEVQVTGAYLPSGTAAGTMPRWKDLQTVLEMPVLGFNTGFVCSYWEWDFSNAEVAPAATSFQFFRAFLPTMQDWVNLGALRGAQDGAVSVTKIRWRLAAPLAACVF
jgi:hypothetical protein